MKVPQPKRNSSKLTKNLFSQEISGEWKPDIQKDSKGYPYPPHPLAPNLKHRIITQFEAVLFKIETIIMDVTQTHGLFGQDVLSVLARLLWTHECRLRGTNPKLTDIKTHIPLNEQGILLYNQLLRKIPEYAKSFVLRFSQKKNRNISPHTLIWQCFEVIYDSCLYWMHKEGPEGYLEYISEFMIPDDNLFDDNMMRQLEDEFDSFN